MNTTGHQKLLQTIRAQLTAMAKDDHAHPDKEEPGYADCVRALNFAESVHTGVRKDGKTPEFYHQVSILAYLMTQHRNLEDPRSVYVAAILHDTTEDYPELEAQVAAMFPKDIANITGLSKVRKGQIVPYTVYFSEMAHNPVTSVVKLVDRMHNVSTMPGVFKPEKMRKYIDEIVKHFLPMAKAARRNFPQQDAFYELAKSELSRKVASHTYFLNEIDRLQDEIRQLKGEVEHHAEQSAGPDL